MFGAFFLTTLVGKKKEKHLLVDLVKSTCRNILSLITDLSNSDGKSL